MTEYDREYLLRLLDGFRELLYFLDCDEERIEEAAELVSDAIALLNFRDETDT